MVVEQFNTLTDVNTEEAVLLGDELRCGAQDPNQGALVEALLSVDSEL